jgi:prephenate dehydratase
MGNGNGVIPHVNGRDLKIGVSGIIGSYSQKAAFGWAAENDISRYDAMYLIEIGPVLAHVESGAADIGIFPIYNTSVGLIEPAFQAMSQHNFAIIDKHQLFVHHYLLALPNVTKDMLTAIASQRPAIDQCERRLHREWKHVNIDYTADTATAAKYLSEGKLPPTTGVIASKSTAGLYGLEVLQDNFQDDTDNATTFLVIKQRR